MYKSGASVSRLSIFFIIFSNNWIISFIENSQSTVPELKLALLVVCGGGSGVW